MRNGNYITNSRLLLLNFAFYSNTAFGTGITSGLNDSTVVFIIFLYFFVFPAVGLSVAFLIAKWYCKKRNLTRITKLLNRVFIFLILGLLLLVFFLSYGI